MWKLACLLCRISRCAWCAVCVMSVQRLVCVSCALRLVCIACTRSALGGRGPSRVGPFPIAGSGELRLSLSALHSKRCGQCARSSACCPPVLPAGARASRGILLGAAGQLPYLRPVSARAGLAARPGARCSQHVFGGERIVVIILEFVEGHPSSHDFPRGFHGAAFGSTLSSSRLLLSLCYLGPPLLLLLRSRPSGS